MPTDFLINRHEISMKTINTQDLDNAVANLDTLTSLLHGMIDDDFVVLEHDNKQDYIQTTPDEGGYVVEVRYYPNVDDENEFSHFRKIFDDIDDVVHLFWLFFNDKPIQTENWTDITKDFDDHIYLKTNINNTPFDYYVFYDELVEQVMKCITDMSNKDMIAICPDGEDGKQMLQIHLNGDGYQIIYQDDDILINKTIKHEQDLQAVIIRFQHGDVSDFINEQSA